MGLVNDNMEKAVFNLSVLVPLGLPGAFQAALHGILTAKEYDQAVRDTMRCGGCTCSRSSFIGACLGAQVGGLCFIHVFFMIMATLHFVLLDKDH